MAKLGRVGAVGLLLCGAAAFVSAPHRVRLAGHHGARLAVAPRVAPSCALSSSSSSLTAEKGRVGAAWRSVRETCAPVSLLRRCDARRVARLAVGSLAVPALYCVLSPNQANAARAVLAFGGMNTEDRSNRDAYGTVMMVAATMVPVFGGRIVGTFLGRIQEIKRLKRADNRQKEIEQEYRESRPRFLWVSEDPTYAEAVEGSLPLREREMYTLRDCHTGDVRGKSESDADIMGELRNKMNNSSSTDLDDGAPPAPSRAASRRESAVEYARDWGMVLSRKREEQVSLSLSLSLDSIVSFRKESSQRERRTRAHVSDAREPRSFRKTR